MDDTSRAEARRWAEDVSCQVLEWVWKGFDRFRAEHLSKVDMEQPLEELERDLTRNHFVAVNQTWAMETQGFASLTPAMEWPEVENRPPPPGRSPAYDFAFVCNDNPRVAWPVEAKVLPTSGRLAPYEGDVKRFTDGTAAPFVGEGGMIGYLLKGAPNDFFANLEVKLGQTLGTCLRFSARPHRTTLHTRSTAPALRLHHMIMECESPSL